MKLQQLRYIWEVAHHDLNVSATAQSLYTSQPGISKQVRLLEDELGVEIFVRSGKHLVQISPAGEKILQVAGEVLQQVESIKHIAQEFNEPNMGTLDIAASDVAACFILPNVISKFSKKYPKVIIHLNQNAPQNVIQQASDGEVNLGFATDSAVHPSELIFLPAFRWNYSVLVPKDHPLTTLVPLALPDIADYPMITYTTGTVATDVIGETFHNNELTNHSVCSATDTDVIKSYVRKGMGIGIIASMSFDAEHDTDLVALDARHLFPASTTNIALCKKSCLRGFMYDFIASVAPHLTHEVLKKAFTLHNRDEREELLRSLRLPEY
jgi:LysR family cys regulon transcriptional activator